MTRRIVTLLTDFGYSDYFVAAMKGRILSMAPEANVQDASHGIPSHSIMAGALALEGYWRLFPEGSVHLCVVDPGVGTRRGVLVAACEGHFFVAPDNGLLTPIIDEGAKLWEMTDLKRFCLNPAPTFHGRDVFAPLTAWLTNNDPRDCDFLKVLAPSMALRLDMPAPLIGHGFISGRVIHGDNFGNLLTNIREEHLCSLCGTEKNHGMQIRAADWEFPLVDTFAQAGPAGATLSLIGSSGRLELCVVQGRAADLENLQVGAAIQVTLAGGGQ